MNNSHKQKSFFHVIMSRGQNIYWDQLFLFIYKLGITSKLLVIGRTGYRAPQAGSLGYWSGSLSYWDTRAGSLSYQAGLAH
jgi:hypothetical protein